MGMSNTMEGAMTGQKAKRAGQDAALGGRQGAEAPQGVHGAPPPAAVVQHPPASDKKIANRPKRAALYLRVSTDTQTTDNQAQELADLAQRAGWEITHRFTDHAVSGARGRAKRPGLDAMLKAATRREFDILLVWSVDRLGRSLQDLIATLNDLHAVERDLFILKQNVDTSTPSGRAMFQMLGVFAEFERTMIVDRVRSGMARARAQGKRLGRAPTPAATEAAIRLELRNGTGILKTARLHKVGTGTVQRIKRELTGA